MSDNHPAPLEPQAPLSYRDAGVDIDAGDALVDRIKPLAKRTMRPEVLGGIGGFGALFELSKKYKEPVLVSGTDGVGTKLKLAFQLNKHDTVGQDLVAMSVNDILVQGAESLFFLDYFACGKLDVDTAADVVKGIARGCELAGCALIGGETAEMPGFYPIDEYDLAGYCTGVVDKDRIIDNKTMTPGDVIIALPSSGVHSNGFSLVRKVFDVENRNLTLPVDELGGKSIGETLLTPTKIYVKPVLALLEKIKVKGISHITGGGFYENIPRSIPDSLGAKIDRSAVKVLPIFDLIAKAGNICERDMFNTFNMGVGMSIVVSKDDADEALSILKASGEDPYIIGEIVSSAEKIEIC